MCSYPVNRVLMYTESHAVFWPDMQIIFRSDYITRYIQITASLLPAEASGWSLPPRPPPPVFSWSTLRVYCNLNISREHQGKNVLFLGRYSIASTLGLYIDFLSSAADVVHFSLVFSSQVTKIYGWPEGDETRTQTAESPLLEATCCWPTLGHTSPECPRPPQKLYWMFWSLCGRSLACSSYIYWLANSLSPHSDQVLV